jgi:8-oxo-dGTP diphosphatase
MSTKHGLVIGRFQVVGDQHADLFEQIVEHHFREQQLEQLNVGIGVANTIDFRNPFSATEAWQMIQPVAEKAARKMRIPLEHRLVDDINDPPNYAAHVNRTFGFSHQDIVSFFSSNDYTNQCFEQRDGYLVVPVEERIHLHSSGLRDLLAEGIDISDLVPTHIPHYLQEHKARERLAKMKFSNPVPTADIVIEYEGGIVIIERAGDPPGYALPGGHVDYGESTEAAAVREAKEETNLEIYDLKLIGVFSDPERDPRGHKMSVAYSAKGKGELMAKSDAKRVHIYSPDKVPGLAFDHDQILERYKQIDAR